MQSFFVAMTKCPMLTFIQQVKLCCRGRGQAKTTLKQTIDHSANLTSRSVKLLIYGVGQMFLLLFGLDDEIKNVQR